MNSYKDLIYKKRKGYEHSEHEIKQIINGLIKKEFMDYQLSAWLMAVCINGMSLDECAYLTEAMAKSGEIIDLSKIGKYVIDKHSTGGVGDKRFVHIGYHVGCNGLLHNGDAVGPGNGDNILPGYSGKDAIVLRMSVKCFVPYEKDV